MFSEQRKGLGIVVSIAVIQCDRNCPFREVVAPAVFDQFLKIHHLKTSLEKKKLSFKLQWIEGRKKRMSIGGNLVKHEHLEPSMP